MIVDLPIYEVTVNGSAGPSRFTGQVSSYSDTAFTFMLIDGGGYVGQRQIAKSAIINMGPAA